ncbi:hypothetical protein DFR72_103385 [Lentzea flaviverrucosa]|uniref:Uncharacterized protein n=1 Tax=Lentzea flaviverrucosa TaxID=200379 RepID=A0A1H9AS17_9PSEU|nr:hypothetical protein DFR72_103385 [Lentzea flaviverrucosa]SEP79449.1 hypothetical protein SAMN05216195_101273 [Lentzea flaviverrucosa]
MRWGETFDGVGVAETVLAVLVLALGVVTLFLAETAAAEVLLAMFMGSILLMLMVELADHAGVFRGAVAHR